MPGSTSCGLPVPDPCISFWQQTTRSFPYLHANRDAAAPSGEDGSIKYAIIGSGISGALTAFKLLEGGVAQREVVILEAREAASGASSRNAGHVRPDAFRGFAPYARLHGPEQALKILDNESAVFKAVDAFVKQHSVPCDFNPTTTFDVCLTQEFADFLAQSFAEYRDAGGDISGIKFYSAEEAPQRTGVKKALAAYEWEAGSSHPAKLAQWLLRSCVERGVQLFTHCPVTSIAEVSTEGAPRRWQLTTPRGTLKTDTVIHCTNAHVSHLLPQLSPYTTPNRAQAHALVPPAALCGDKTLQSTMSLRHGLKHFYSVAQRPADGIIILGSSRANPNLSRETMEGLVSADDSKGFDSEILADAVSEFWDTMLDDEVEAHHGINGGEKQVNGTDSTKGPEDHVNGDLGSVRKAKNRPSFRHGEGLLHAWTGIIGLTSDSCPYIGRVPGSEDQWVCAGFNGHGMARIFTCAPGLVKLIQGGKWSDTGLPECFELTDERLDKLKMNAGKGSVW
ncbi:Uu.00g069330.m01.CDS01 [Anthostomella pinea]|uniref:Uu.00g069330.m01.CDS01 n=1 Tax=Anthostomella pinea TaxID=933095 RepID=A0AAI8VVP9_9PEZI|nr:Uu.00g069330.m01.CDS01 [Anthostomella pinea]